MRVIGVDPGLRKMGWGVVEMTAGRLKHVANGVCAAPTDAPLGARLAVLFRQLDEVLTTHGPSEAAVEQTFVNKDAAGTLKLGQARGVAMLAPSLRGLPVAEYAPNAVKKAVVGVGHAQKPQIAHMIGVLLPGAAVAGPDAADALAIAICHVYVAGSAAKRAALTASGASASGPSAAARGRVAP